ncbi:glycosyltransferase family 2 protein [Croceicoccus mobilis]|nr:glycosyltransferase family 2 protein [Croceicoccus mobilis]
MELIKSRVILAMPVYNGANYVAQAIESILAQTHRDFRLIVTDNASTDATPDIVGEFAARDERVTLVRNPVNLGASRNYNLGYDLSDGEYLKWCAHDDILGPTALETCIAALDDDPTLAVAFPRTISIGTNGEILPDMGHDTPSLMDADPVRRFADMLDTSGTCYPIFGLMRRSMLSRTMLHQSYYGSDRALLAEMAVRGRIRRIEQSVIYNREHEVRSINIDDKLERSRWQSGKSGRFAAAEHIQLLTHLLRIASRSKDAASPMALRREVLKRSTTKKQLGRYALEIAAMISPRLARSLKSMFRSSAKEKLSAA